MFILSLKMSLSMLIECLRNPPRQGLYSFIPFFKKIKKWLLQTPFTFIDNYGITSSGSILTTNNATPRLLIQALNVFFMAYSPRLAPEACARTVDICNVCFPGNITIPTLFFNNIRFFKLKTNIVEVVNTLMFYLFNQMVSDKMTHISYQRHKICKI